MSSKRAAKEIVILAFLAALAFGAGLGFAKAFPEETEELIYITDVESADVVGLEFSGADNFTLALTGDEWQLSGNEGYMIDSKTVSAELKKLCGINALRRLEGLRADTVYGLDEPQWSVSLQSGGKHHRIEIGDYNPSVNSYYLRADGDTYLVRPFDVEGLKYNLLDFAARPSLNHFTYDALKKISVESSAAAFEILPYDKQSGELYSSSYNWKLSGYKDCILGVDDDAIYKFISAVKAVNELQGTEYAGDAQTAGAYGLNNPVMKADFVYEATAYNGQKYDTQLEMLVGMKDDALYAVFNNSPVVYALTDELAAVISYFAAGEHYMSSRVCAVEPEEITGLVITKGDRIYDIEIKDAEYSEVYVNGSKSSAETVKNIAELVTGIECYGLAKENDFETSLTVCIKRNVAGYEEMTMAFSRNNVDFYNVSFGAIDNYLINKNYVSALENLLKDL